MWRTEPTSSSYPRAVASSPTHLTRLLHGSPFTREHMHATNTNMWIKNRHGTGKQYRYSYVVMLAHDSYPWQTHSNQKPQERKEKETHPRGRCFGLIIPRPRRRLILSSTSQIYQPRSEWYKCDESSIQPLYLSYLATSPICWTYFPYPSSSSPSGEGSGLLAKVEWSCTSEWRYCKLLSIFLC